MLFNFHAFIKDLLENQEKSEVVHKYIEYYGNIDSDIENQIWHEKYINKFKTVEYKIPVEMENDFDWPLLMKLIAGSFSSGALLERNKNGEVEFMVRVESNEKGVVKKIHELKAFQILRLFEIYIEEIINLQVLKFEDDREKESIEDQKEKKLEIWENVLLYLEKEDIISESMDDLLDLLDTI